MADSPDRRDRPALGIAAMIAAMVLLPFVDTLIKSLATSYDATLITWARNLIHALCLAPIVLIRFGAAALLPALSRWQLVRGAAFALMTLPYVVALRWMPLADALAIIFLFPFMVTALSPVVLGERVGAGRWIAVATGFAGICLVIKPGVGELNPGVPFALLAAIMAVAYTLLTRKLAGTAPSLVMVFVPAVIGCIILTPAAMALWQTPAAADIPRFILIGVLAALVHYLMVLAYRFAEASLVVPLTYLQIVMGLALGYLVFGDLPDALAWLGIVAVVASGLVLVRRTP